MTYYANDPTVMEEILVFLLSITISGIFIGFSMFILAVMIKCLLPTNKGAENDKEKNIKTNSNHTNTNNKDNLSDIQERETLVDAKPLTEEEEIDRVVDKVIANMVSNRDE
mgnify:CR=1 FL=1